MQCSPGVCLISHSPLCTAKGNTKKSTILLPPQCMAFTASSTVGKVIAVEVVESKLHHPIANCHPLTATF
jgi:hypothetical protein